MNKRIFDKKQYQAAKAFLADAKIIGQYESSIVRNTTYQKDGKQYFEHESLLESPEDDYYVTEMES